MSKHQDIFESYFSIPEGCDRIDDQVCDGYISHAINEEVLRFMNLWMGFSLGINITDTGILDEWNRALEFYAKQEHISHGLEITWETKIGNDDSWLYPDFNKGEYENAPWSVEDGETARKALENFPVKSQSYESSTAIDSRDQRIKELEAQVQRYKDIIENWDR